jgi:4-amino-4-deoxy-L-arabinose transferase-like glycosyltransferase
MTGRDRAWLAALALLFLAWRVPLMYRTVAGQDEDWYAVPGVTIPRTGVPQIPYIPSRDPGSACYKADVILYALPPLGFYLQAVVNLFLGFGIGPSRVASAVEGLVAAWLVYDLARVWTGSSRAARLAVLAYLTCRPFVFPATTARPDMAAVMFGLLAVRLAVAYGREPRRSWLVGSGIAAGLSLLSHPFGAVPATQVGLALLTGHGLARKSLGDAALFGSIATLVFALWVPLILLHPEIFRAQFGANVLGRAGPGLGATLLAPWTTLSYQARQFLDFATPMQAFVLSAGAAWGLVGGGCAGGRFRYHLAASILLLILFEGRHPTLGYYAFPGALACIGVGMLGDAVAGAVPVWIWRHFGWGGRPCAPSSDPVGRAGTPAPPGGEPLRREWSTGLVACVILLALLPGSGLRPWLAQIRHWRDPAYNARAIAREVLADIPAGALAAVDGGLVLDVYLAGRPVIDLTIHPLAYDVRAMEFEYAVFTRAGLRLYKPEMDDLVLVKTYGIASDPFAVYAELYRRGADR